MLALTLSSSAPRHKRVDASAVCIHAEWRATVHLRDACRSIGVDVSDAASGALLTVSCAKRAQLVLRFSL
jgi:hypothetical protein